MSGISLTASFFYCHPEAHTLLDVRHSGSTDRCEAVLIMEMLNQAGYSRKRVLLVSYASRGTAFALGNYRLQHDAKEDEDQQVRMTG